MPTPWEQLIEDQDRKRTVINDNMPSWAQMETAIKAAFPDTKQQNVILKMAKVLNWIAKNKAD